MLTDKRHVIPGKTVTHNGVAVASDEHGNVTVDIPGQPQLKLTQAEYLRLVDMLGHLYDWGENE